MDRKEVFLGSEDIITYNDLFQAENLLNDNTQKILLPYIRETKTLFERALRKYDYCFGGNETKGMQSSVMIFPSLDLGFPNNIQRLAGGFATGMLIMWESGEPVVPVDATVNVCSSSVYEMKDFDTDMEVEAFIKYVENITSDAERDMGYSCSFDSGNHFLMIAQDINTKKLYLVLHSSAKEMKDSYLGLYPSENNWYSNSIILETDSYAQGRYIRYIKGDNAAYFTEKAHKLESYNIQIHNWFADMVGKGKKSEKDNTYHHYYMPTDNSIALGTYVEEEGTTVPIFSDVGKDIYLFKIGKNNWKVKLGTREVCLVPHGWGQAIDYVKTIKVDYENKRLGIDEAIYNIHSKARMKNEGNKHVRCFKDGSDFLEKGKRMIKGDIVQTLRPIYLYCSKKKGKVNDIFK